MRYTECEINGEQKRSVPGRIPQRKHNLNEEVPTWTRYQDMWQELTIKWTIFRPIQTAQILVVVTSVYSRRRQMLR
jgi:hypothetical protein